MTQRRKEQEAEERKNILGVIAYLLTLPGGVIVYLLAGEDKELKESAEKSISIFGTLMLVSVVLTTLHSITSLNIFIHLNTLCGLVTFLLWMYCTIQTFRKEQVELPYVEEIRRRIFGK